MLYKLIFQPFGKKAEIEEGKTILQVARDVGIHIPAYCGGKRTCGKCRVKIANGQFDKYQINSSMQHLSPLSIEEKKLFSQKEMDEGYRLACAAKIQGDLVIDIPQESQMQTAVILEEGATNTVTLNPAVKIYHLTLEKATLEDNRDDLTRINDALEENKNLEKPLSIDFDVLKRLSKTIRKGHWKISVYILNDQKIIGVTPGHDQTYYGAAVDIGTTTVVAKLCDLGTGEVISKQSFINPQVRYGDDVISRISYCQSNKNGLITLQKLLMMQLNTVLDAICQSQGLSSEAICEVVLVFNTVMESIAIGLSPDAIGMSPFTATISKGIDIPSENIGLRIMPGGNVHCLPSEAAFVGADNVAVLIAEEPYKQKKIKLIIDIGTNSEICLGNQDKLYVTSCATGPALEGAQIKCGMRAAKGAIEAVAIDPISLEPQIRIIGEKEGVTIPVGICGSGILDVVAQMALTGIIEPNGKFSKRVRSKRIREDEKGRKEYVLYFKQKADEQDIVVTVADVSAVQLAKSALYTGCKILMKYYGVEAVDEVVLAGAFGSYIDCRNALALGLFPDIKYNKIKVAGNAAATGAQLALCNVEKRQEAEKVARSVTFVETATEKQFSKYFSQAMLIPHKKDAFVINKPFVFNCPGLDPQTGNTVISEYPYQQLEELLVLDDAAFIEIVQTKIMDHQRLDLPENVFDIPGPFGLLAFLISPDKLYVSARKKANALNQVLETLTKILVSYTKEKIEGGSKIISYGDPSGEMEYVGEAFYKKISGKYTKLFFTEIKPDLRESLVHICGKTSYSMEKSGFMLAKPYRINNQRPYYDILFEEAKSHKIRFVGHGCLNQKYLPEPILYQMELI